MSAPEVREIRDVERLLSASGYVADHAIATGLFLALRMRRPLLVEGHAGVGKTEIAKVLAHALDAELLRLQCYEGLDASAALYEWNYAKQILRIRMEEQSEREAEEKESLIFGEDYLLERPLLAALRHEGAVLLIDEIDRADEEFEAFLLEVLSDFQVSIPELGTVRASVPPYVVLTSNRVRELGDALRRRCLYMWIDYPSFDKEMRIVRAKVPEIGEELAAQICRFVESLRTLDLDKRPGVAETLDWGLALTELHLDALAPEVVEATLGCVAKTKADTERIRESLPELMERAVGAG